MNSIEVITTGQNTVEVQTTDNSTIIEIVDSQPAYEVEVSTIGGGDAYLGGVNQHFSGNNFFDNVLTANELHVTGTSFLFGQVDIDGTLYVSAPLIWFPNLPEYANNNA